MTVQFIGGDVWLQITKACQCRGQRRAAIAFLGRDAPRLLPLRRGDVLVVNASDAALLARATSPDALEAYLAAGVRVWSTPRLHAKVLVTPQQAVIGSANASMHSSQLDEGVVVTDDRVAIAAVRAFITGLGETIPVDDKFVSAARATWERGRPSRLPGAGDGQTDPGFLPRQFRLYLVSIETYEPRGMEDEVFRQARRRARPAAGPPATYNLDWIRLHRDDEPFRRNDVVVQIYDDDDRARRVWPPVVVFSDPLPIPRSRSVIQLVRGRSDLAPLPADEVTAALRAAGVAGRLEDRWVRSSAARDTLLDLWGVTPPG